MTDPASMLRVHHFSVQILNRTRPRRRVRPRRYAKVIQRHPTRGERHESRCAPGGCVLKAFHVTRRTRDCAASTDPRAIAAGDRLARPRSSSERIACIARQWERRGSASPCRFGFPSQSRCRDHLGDIVLRLCGAWRHGRCQSDVTLNRFLRCVRRASNGCRLTSHRRRDAASIFAPNAASRYAGATTSAQLRSFV